MSIGYSVSVDRNPALLLLERHGILPEVVMDDHTRVDDRRARGRGTAPRESHPANENGSGNYPPNGRARRDADWSRNRADRPAGRQGRSCHSHYRNGHRTANGCGGRARPCQVFPRRPGRQAMIKTLGEPFAQVRFAPSGHVGQENAADYLASASICAAGGNWMATRTFIKGGHFDEIVRHNFEASSMVAAARLPRVDR